jgi:hypothetical protein
MNMTRREAVIKMAVLMGASVVGPRLLARNFGLATPLDFSDADIALLDEIGETIIPATHIPGAKAVNIGAFIAMMVADCYTPRAHEAFRAGLARLPADYEKRFGEKFIGGQTENRTMFLNELDTEQRKYTSANRRKMEDFNAGLTTDEVPPHYFRVIRELTILGYFSSEIGSTKAVRYLEVPGRYDGNVPYKRGDEWFS